MSAMWEPPQEPTYDVEDTVHIHARRSDRPDEFGVAIDCFVRVTSNMGRDYGDDNQAVDIAAIAKALEGQGYVVTAHRIVESRQNLLAV